MLPGMTTETRHDEVRRWLAGVGTIAAAVNAPVELPALLDLIAATACELTGYEAGGVLLADDDEHALYISGSHGLSAEYVARVNAEHTIKLGSGPLSAGPSSRAFRTAEPVAISDLSEDPSFARMKSEAQATPRLPPPEADLEAGDEEPWLFRFARSCTTAEVWRMGFSRVVVFSTLSTVAPSSARNWPAEGPASTLASSTTTTPSSSGRIDIDKDLYNLLKIQGVSRESDL